MNAETAYIAGVGQTVYSRRSGRSEQSLAIEAILAAVRDAGFKQSDVDGLIGYTRSVPVDDLTWLFPRMRWTGLTRTAGASSGEALHLAACAIGTGQADVIVAFQARNGSSGERVERRILGRAGGAAFRRQLEHPYGWITPAQWYAMLCRRHMEEYGTSPGALALVAMTMRANAQLNPSALMYRRPMSMADYLGSPMIADPYRKADCCLESDGGCAIVIADAGAMPRGNLRRVRIAGTGIGQSEPADDITNRVAWFETGVKKAASCAFEAAGVGPQDMDAAMIYDCFTFEVLHQLEEAGFCPAGGAGPFVESGAIGAGGSLPVNPHGGLLGEAHMLGMNHVIEGVRQLRQEAGARQLEELRWLAVSGWGGLGDGSFAVLARD